jgi:phospholipid/cholesterol/gamma-HCH transport system permease protein
MDGRPDSLSVALSGRGWNARTDRDAVVVALTGDWIEADNAHAEVASVEKILDAAGEHRISFESGELGHWDSALLIFAAALHQGARERGIEFDDKGLPGAATRLLALTAQAVPATNAAAVHDPLVDRVGQGVIDTWNEALAVTTLVGDTVLTGGIAMRGRAMMRRSDLLACMQEAGVSALPIVIVVNILIGGIVAFVGAVELRRFGADIFVADLIGVAMIREMAALVTAIVMSGRTGGAYAAHIATMVGNEEIDALRAIGIPIHEYLILPRMAALTCMMPLLYLYGCVAGIFGGFAVVVTMLNMSPEAFIEQTRVAVAGSQVILGLVKSTTFGALIAIVGCRSGLRAGRSAADVGKAATTAVVAGIVGVIALDAVFAICANALNI